MRAERLLPYVAPLLILFVPLWMPSHALLHSSQLRCEDYNDGPILPDLKPDAPLVFDIGLSNGRDTAWFLRRGAKVISVEASKKTIDTTMVTDAPIALSLLENQGRVVIENYAISREDGGFLKFYNEAGLSQTNAAR